MYAFLIVSVLITLKLKSANIFNSHIIAGLSEHFLTLLLPSVCYKLPQKLIYTHSTLPELISSSVLCTLWYFGLLKKVLTKH